MPEYKLPKTIAVVVQSDVIGATAVSVPVVDTLETDSGFSLLITKDAVDAAIEEEEMKFTKPHEEDLAIDQEELARLVSQEVVLGNRNWPQIAEDCGWTRTNRKGDRVGDGERVRAMLGIGPAARPTPITYDEANALVKAIDADPVDVGV